MATPAAPESSASELITLAVNGVERQLPASKQLLWALREDLGLTGAKPGCGEGACGSCTVLANGKPVRSCQVATESVAGSSIGTIEGLAAKAALHPVQQAFAELGAAQCGYCTPGMILSAISLLEADPDPDDIAIDAALAGHICRCGCYPRIRAAVHRAAESTRPGGHAAADGGTGTSAGETGRWGPPEPGESWYRPPLPWNLTEPEDRDWFGVLGDGLVVVVPRPASGAGPWTTSGGAWLHIGPAGDGVQCGTRGHSRAGHRVVAFTGKVDVGQDNTTAFRLLVAEELGIPLEHVRLASGDTDLCPFDMGTFGSRSMPDAGSALRRAAAFARGLLPVSPGTRRLEIAAADPELTDAARWRTAGQSLLPTGMLRAVTGERRFVTDLGLPGLWYGAVLRPPVPGGTLAGLDTSPFDRRADVALVRTAEVTGVVAADRASARRTVAELAASARWDLPDAPSDSGITGYLRAHPAEPADGWGGSFSQVTGSAETALETAEMRCAATYTAAYIAPAPMETRAALAIWDDGRVTVWTGTQNPFRVRDEVAAATGVDAGQVRVIVPPTGGAFGGKHSGVVAVEAAILARASGRPVQVHWSRAEEFTAGTLRPAAVIDIAAGIGPAGMLAGWTFRNVNAGSAGIRPPYRVDDQRLDYQPAESPLPQASYRALAATANNFARESMIDELAERARIDPVEFRLRNLADNRLGDVLRAVADRVSAARAGNPPGGEERDGWGIACGLEKDGRVATAARVRVGPDNRVRVTALITGYECGAVANPATVRGQIEGAAVMALGGAMFEAIRFTDGAISNGAFSAYRVPRMADVPPVEVILLNRPDLPSAGAGETPMIAVAPAIASAIFTATGRRIRSLPLTDDGVLR